MFVKIAFYALLVACFIPSVSNDVEGVMRYKSIIVLLFLQVKTLSPSTSLLG